MKILLAVLGVILILLILWDAFETILLPRRVTRRFRITRFFFRYTWLPWSACIRSLFSGIRQETYLAFYGPLSVILLLILWATGLIFGFAMLQWAYGSAIAGTGNAPGFRSDLYMSGTTFFTLGLGDVVPRTTAARVITAIEAGIGFGFLALVIGFIPAFIQSFSRREVNISLLDARAGSPPTAAEMLIRHSGREDMEGLRELLADWEIWSAELLESHVSYPMLAYFRSQHNNQSWLGALTAILDTCSFLIAGLEGGCERQAELTFAIARHAIVDLASVFSQSPEIPGKDRLPPIELRDLRARLASCGLKVREGSDSDQKLLELRQMYEPYLFSLSRYFGMRIPPWVPEPGSTDNWQTSAWGTIPGFRNGALPKRVGTEDF